MSCVIRFRNRGLFIFFDEAQTALDDPLRVTCLNLLGVAAEDLFSRMRLDPWRGSGEHDPNGRRNRREGKMIMYQLKCWPGPAWLKFEGKWVAIRDLD
jgi:hypothetical protein